MNRISFWLAAAVSSSVLTATSAFAATQQLGVQDFVDGTSTILLTDFMGTGDSFNQFQGVDAKWVPEDITEPASTTATGNWGWEWNYSARCFEWG